jgi:hypothetical protein
MRESMTAASSCRSSFSFDLASSIHKYLTDTPESCTPQAAAKHVNAARSVHASPAKSDLRGSLEVFLKAPLSPDKAVSTPVPVVKPAEQHSAALGTTQVLSTACSPASTRTSSSAESATQGLSKRERVYDAAAAKPRAALWATECEDFITPWYTYAARFLMLPLGALSLYFIYWRWCVLPLNSTDSHACVHAAVCVQCVFMEQAVITRTCAQNCFYIQHLNR